MRFAEADEARALCMARNRALEADGTKRVERAFGGADDGRVSWQNLRRTLEEAESPEKPFPQLRASRPCAGGGEKLGLDHGRDGSEGRAF